MPTYDYDCRACGAFDAVRSMAARDEPAACPRCGAASVRVFASAPRLALLAGHTRRALDRNERAAHEPQSSRGYTRLAHPAGCGCCAPMKRSATTRAPDGAKSFPSKRPWMISH